MVVDSSALLAVLFLEPGHQALLAKMKASAEVAIGTPTLVETLIVLTGRSGGNPSAPLKELLEAIEAEVVPFTEDHSRAALKACLRYGKGRHPAALNFGDCLSYAVASVAGQPLLYVGDDFSKTDIRKA
jgi:ribonuclease VapC